jgi:hypothetical protein
MLSAVYPIFLDEGVHTRVMRTWEGVFSPRWPQCLPLCSPATLRISQAQRTTASKLTFALTLTSVATEGCDGVVVMFSRRSVETLELEGWRSVRC